MSYWKLLRYIPWQYLERIRKSADKDLRDPNKTARDLIKKWEQMQNIYKKTVEILLEEDIEKPKMEYEPPDKTAVKLPKLEDILSPPIKVNESKSWVIPRLDLIGKGGLFGGLLGKGGLPGPGVGGFPVFPFSCPLLSGSKGGRFPGLFDEKRGGPLAPWIPSIAQMPGKNGGLEHLKTIREMYDKMFEQIIGGNDKIMASFALMFRKMLEWATGSFDRIGQRSTILNKDLYGGLSSYAMNLGTVSGYASKAFAAFRTLNPFGAAAASFGLIALGQMLRSLSSGMGGGAGWGGGSATRLATAGAGGSTAESTWRGPQVVNVYIDGIRSANVYEVDRSLDRAGVDRELRNRIRELVRTGSNPIREY
jgi:hypothetical protein